MDERKVQELITNQPEKLPRQPTLCALDPNAEEEIPICNSGKKTQISRLKWPNAGISQTGREGLHPHILSR